MRKNQDFKDEATGDVQQYCNLPANSELGGHVRAKKLLRPMPNDREPRARPPTNASARPLASRTWRCGSAPASRPIRRPACGRRRHPSRGARAARRTRPSCLCRARARG
eukprot:6870703-Prymnesium_polylepis.1